MAMSSQWRWSGGNMPRRVGLDYSALEHPIRSLGIRKKNRGKAFSGMQIMEHAALDEWDRQYKNS